MYLVENINYNLVYGVLMGFYVVIRTINLVRNTLGKAAE